MYRRAQYDAFGCHRIGRGSPREVFAVEYQLIVLAVKLNPACATGHLAEICKTALRNFYYVKPVGNCYFIVNLTE